MSNRNLMHYFSPNVEKPVELTSPLDDVPGDTATTAQSGAKRTRTGGAKVTSIILEDDDFENDPILPPQHGNSITKYFSPVDRSTITRKPKKPCLMTVQVQVHGSPQKLATNNPTTKKIPRKKKRKTGIPSALADTIELVSSEELVTTDSSPSPEAMEIDQPTAPLPETPRTQWKMKIRLADDVKVSDDDVEDSDSREGPRRSTRLRSKPIHMLSEPEEVETKKAPKKKRKKGELKKKQEDDDVKILSEDIAPIFLKKKWEEEARAVKKAKQEFLFSGVPEVLKQQTAVFIALEQRPVEIFPKISHVTQSGSRPWRLPYPDQLSLVLRENLSHSKINRPTIFSSSLNSSLIEPSSVANRSTSLRQASCLEWRYCKEWITRLKEDHSLSYPFFRTLRMLLPKANKESDGENELPWTDAYAPKQSVDILAHNRKPAQRLKTWLNQWKLKAGEEVTLSPKKPVKKIGKRKRIASDCSDSDEIAADETSNASWKSEEQICNCVLLVGPAGCGKTATVYALAEELGFNVLEVNASSKRNGKTVLSHLHEATQSHSLNNNANSVASSMNKLFFGGKAAAKPNRPENKTSLSLVLFEDVDIVFESEDESFYSALTTLIQTSKRPIILTLGTTDERALTQIQDKIKSYFDIFSFASPDHFTTCGYLWSLCLSEGYPLEWKSLENWLASRTAIDLDLRSLVLQLQFLLHSHPLRLQLNFSQLQLKNEEENPNCGSSGSSWKPSSDSDTIPVQLIELPLNGRHREWPYTSAPRSSRFTYDVDYDAITFAENKGKGRFSRILPNDGLVDDSGLVDGSITDDKKPLTKNERWRGDLTHLVRCLDLRASKELFSSCLASDNLSWNDASLLQDIHQLVTDRCIKLMEKDLGEVAQSSLESSISDLRTDQSIRSANHTLLQSSVSRSMLLQRRSHSTDVLPYLRSFLRFDLERSVGKRRRKPRSRLESPTTRLPSLDLILSTSSAILLANNF